MQVRTVTFERVFDAPHAKGNFSFDSGGKSFYGVLLPGGEIPRAGETFGLVLDGDENAPRVVAHRNLAGSKVVLRESVWGKLVEWASDLALVGIVPPALALLVGGPVAGLAVLVLEIGAIGWALERHARRNREAARALLALPAPAARTQALDA